MEFRETTFVPAKRRLNRKAAGVGAGIVGGLAICLAAIPLLRSGKSDDVAAKREMRTAIVVREASDTLRAGFEANDSVVSFDISSAEAHPVLDERKRRGVWEYTAVITAHYKPSETIKKITWVYTSENVLDTKGNVSQCWRELKDTIVGHKNRIHSDVSEWSEEFRAKVQAEWLKSLRQTKGTTSSDLDDLKESMRVVQKAKENVANSLGITPLELDEIVAGPN